jgi:hypothetical protein
VQAGYKFGSVFTTFPEETVFKNTQVMNRYIRLGGGTNITGSVGWMIHNNLGFEISTTYTSGQRKLLEGTMYTEEFKSQNIHSIGSIVAQFPISGFYIYAKAGVVISYFNETKDYFYNQVSSSIDRSYAYNATTSIMRGYNGSFGVLLPIDKRFSVMIEAEEVSVQGNFDKRTLVENNTSLSLPQNIVFVDNIANTISTSTSQFARKYPVSYSCIGVNFGLHYKF